MAFIIKDRVKEGTTSTGTGDVSLGGAAATFDTFQSYMSNGDTTYYAIVHTTSGTDEWEVGLGTWNTGNTLTRTTVLAGSNGTSAVNFSSGTKDIFMTYPASKAAVAGEDVTFADITVTGTVDGRDVAADGTKLDGIDTSADVTDATTVAAAGALMKSGGTMTGNLILNADPTTALGAATKEYVDTIAAAGIHYHTPVRVETPSALTASYDNGTSGVGATLTNSGTQAALVIDGVTVATSDRVLVYNQTNAAHNGIYTVTNTGSSSTNWVLTRATDADSYGVSDPDAFGEGDAFFVKEGDTGAGELYVMNTSGTITFGTTAINFTVIAETAVYSAGTGISLDGTTFSIGQDVGTTDNVTFNQVTADIIGNVTGNLTGDVTGNADTATALETARTIQLSGDVTGSASFDGSANVTITAAVQDDSHAHVISNVDGLQAALDAKADDSTTITAGSGLTGGGSIGVNRTISHADTSTQASVDNSGNTFIQDVTLDTYGHVTGLTSGSVTVGDATITISAGGGLQTGGDFTTNQSTNETITLAHADTSSQASVDNSNGTVIQDITLDTYGHITGLASVNLDGRYYTETEADSRFVNVTGDTMSGALTVSSTITATGNIYSRNGDNSDIVIGEHPSYTNYGAVWLDGESDYRFLADPSGGHTYINALGSGNIYFRNDNGTLVQVNASGTMQVGANTVFHDGYHPNADKWTTARTLTLSGDASGSVSWDGSANATLSVAVANNSHNHTYFSVYGATDLNSLSNAGYDKFVPFASGFQASNRPASNYAAGFEVGVAGGSDNYRGQLAFVAGGANQGPYVRTKTSGTWNSWNQVWHSGNDGSGSGLDADTVDGIQGSSFLRSDTADTASGDITFTGGAGAISVGAGSDLRFTTGNWTGEHSGKIQYHSSHFYFQSGNQWIFRNSSGSNVIYGDQSGNLTAGASMRSPIFYDTNNTSYYLDPASSGTSLYVRGEIQNPSVWINDGDNYNNYNENIRLFAPSGNGVAVIAFRASGVGGLPDSSILGFSDRHEVRWGSQWQTRVYNGYEEAYGSYRAPIFYDSNNTAYYGDFASTSSTNHIRAHKIYDNGGSRGLVLGNFAISNTDQWPLVTWAYGTGYDEGLIHGSSSRGVFSRAHFGIHFDDDRSFAFHTSSWDTEMEICGDGRIYQKGPVGIGAAPTTSSAKLTVFGGSAAWSDGGNQGTTVGSIHLDPESGTDHYGSAITWGASDASSGANAQAGIYIRSDGTYGTKMYLSTTDSYATGSKTSVKIDHSGHVSILRGNLYAPIFYDSNNTGFYVDPASTSNVVRVDAQELNVNGGNRNNSNDGTVYITATNNNDWGLIVNKYNASASEYGVDIRMGSSFSYGLRVLGAGSTKALLGSGTFYHTSDIRAPIFYDYNDTAYYVNPASTSRLNDLELGRYDTTEQGILYLNGSTTSRQAVLKCTNGNLHIDAHSGYGTYINWYGGSSCVWGVGGSSQVAALNSDYFIHNSDVRSPIFYDSNNTSYYVDAASTTVLNNLTVNGTVTGITASARNGYFWENDQTITSNQTITNNKNAMSAGPITINNGVTVTIGSGEAWSIV